MEKIPVFSLNEFKCWFYCFLERRNHSLVYRNTKTALNEQDHSWLSLDLTSTSSPAIAIILRMRPVVLVLPLFIFCTIAMSGTNFFRIGGKIFKSKIEKCLFEHIADNVSSNFLESCSNSFFIKVAKGFNHTSVSLTWLFMRYTASTLFWTSHACEDLYRVTCLNYFFAEFTLVLVAIRGVWD